MIFKIKFRDYSHFKVGRMYDEIFQKRRKKVHDFYKPAVNILFSVVFKKLKNQSKDKDLTSNPGVSKYKRSK